MKKLFGIGLFLILFMTAMVTNGAETINHEVNYKVRPTFNGIGIPSSNEIPDIVSTTLVDEPLDYNNITNPPRRIYGTNGATVSAYWDGANGFLSTSNNAVSGEQVVNYVTMTNVIDSLTETLTNHPLDGLSYLVANVVGGVTNYYWSKIPAAYDVYSNKYAAVLSLSPYNGKTQSYYPTNATTISPQSFVADANGYQMMLQLSTTNAVTFTNCTLVSGSYVTNSGITGVLFDRWSGTSNWVVRTLNP